MSSAISQITFANQKETQPNPDGRIERFRAGTNGGIEVVYPPGWNQSPQTGKVLSSIASPVSQTPEGHTIEEQRAIIRAASGIQDLPTAVRKLKEAVYIIPPIGPNLGKPVLRKAA